MVEEDHKADKWNVIKESIKLVGAGHRIINRYRYTWRELIYLVTTKGRGRRMLSTKFYKKRC